MYLLDSLKIQKKLSVRQVRTRVLLIYRQRYMTDVGNIRLRRWRMRSRSGVEKKSKMIAV